MLINFCNPNQTIAAIDVRDNAITAYLYRRNEADALGKFLKNHFKSFEIKIKFGRNKRNHLTDFHFETSHIQKFPHTHLLFNTTLNSQLLQQFIHSLKKFQSEQMPDLLSDENLEKLEQEIMRGANKTASYSTREIMNFYNDRITQYNPPVMTAPPTPLELGNTTCSELMEALPTTQDVPAAVLLGSGLLVLGMTFFILKPLFRATITAPKTLEMKRL